ncbi:hypothetical protein H6504_00545 [Candidatus Woesearchaeota archaeon]|nr:hypothetical protein [Candidatus Woesearchaeota archaeon]
MILVSELFLSIAPLFLECVRLSENVFDFFYGLLMALFIGHTDKSDDMVCEQFYTMEMDSISVSNGDMIYI